MSTYPPPATPQAEWRAFPRGLRLLSVLGLASLSATVLVDAVGRNFGTLLEAVSESTSIAIPIGWLPFSTALLCVAWSFLFAGALHSPLWLRIVVDALWALVTWPVFTLAPVVTWPGYVLPILLVLWRRWARPRERFGVAEYLAFFAAVALLHVTAAWASVRTGSPEVPPLDTYLVVLSSELIALSAAAFPLLILAGVDLAEMTGRTTDWLMARLTAWSGRALAWVLIGLSLAKAGYFVLNGVPTGPGPWLTCAAVAGLMLIGRWLPHHDFVAKPPFLILVAVVSLALLLPAGGVLFAFVLPYSAVDWIAGTGFVISALLAAVVTLALRKVLERRWPGVWVAVLVIALWIAWLVGARASAWAPSDRALEIALAATCVGVGVVTLRGLPVPRKVLFLGVEATLFLTVIRGIEDVYGAHISLADVFTTVQASLIVGSLTWLWLENRPRLRRAIVAGGLGLIVLAVQTQRAELLTWLQDRSEFVLLGLALAWGVIVAHERLRGALGAQTPTVNRTFLFLGFGLLVLALLSWLRALSPPASEVVDLNGLATFGLVAVGLPLYLLSVAQRLWRPASAEQGHVHGDHPARVGLREPAG